MLQRARNGALLLAIGALVGLLLLLPPLLTLLLVVPPAVAVVLVVKPGSSRRIRGELDRAVREAEARTLTDEKIVIFSDQHRGIRDGADDFQRCERCYVGALASYLARGYHLYVLGDAEELWECTPGEVAGKYAEVFELEGSFAKAGRYQRFWGNHDVYWRDSQRFWTELGKHYGEGVRTREALKLNLSPEGAEPMTVVLTHGHQGTLQFLWVQVLAVKHGWRRLQKALGVASASPAHDWALRRGHNDMLAQWAGEEPRRALIAGHTHKPVFWKAEPHPDLEPPDPEAALAEAEAAVTEAEAGGDPGDVATAHARLEYVKAEIRRQEAQPLVPLPTPCYFNTGCCSYGDGDITGIELDTREIRLIRWSIVDSKPTWKCLERLSLETVSRELE